MLASSFRSPPPVIPVLVVRRPPLLLPPPSVFVQAAPFWTSIWPKLQHSVTLEDLSARAEDRGEYERTGRACMLTGMSTHAQQRGTLLAVRKCGSRVLQCARKSSQPFVTKAARRMVDKSREQRKREQQEEVSPPAKKRKGDSGGSSDDDSSGGNSDSDGSSGGSSDSHE